jgi:nucleoside 2-deoxyribosyltransferase
MKLYLAGPDVFRPDVDAWAKSARTLCRRYGFEPLLPIDHEESEPARIYRANVDLIRAAQVVAANLDPFRGAEPDSGTAFEMGYAVALGKPVFGYLTRRDTQARRVERLAASTNTPLPGGGLADADGYRIEDFGLPCNLMLAIPADIVEGGLEACLRTMRARLPAR